jgi:hypothetical protein
MIGAKEVKPMRPYRWTLVPLPFVALALLVAVLSVVLGAPR